MRYLVAFWIMLVFSQIAVHQIEDEQLARLRTLENSVAESNRSTGGKHGKTIRRKVTRPQHGRAVFSRGGRYRDDARR